MNENNLFSKFSKIIEDVSLDIYKLFVNILGNPRDILSYEVIFNDAIVMTFQALIYLLGHQRGLIDALPDRKPRISCQKMEGFRENESEASDFFFSNRIKIIPPECLQVISLSEIAKRIEDKLSVEPSLPIIPVEYLGMSFEQLVGRMPTEQFGIGFDLSRKNTKRRDRGVFFTPMNVVKFLVNNTLNPLLADIKSQKDARQQAAKNDRFTSWNLRPWESQNI